MNKTRLIIRTLVLLILVSHTILTSAQSPFISTSQIKYDLTTHKTDKPVPFDQAFTLSVEQLKNMDITDVHIYEAKMVDGNRWLVQNIYNSVPGTYNCKCKEDRHQHLSSGEVSTAIKDKSLAFKNDSTGLQIYVNPLRPNKLFDINVIARLSSSNKKLAMNVNSLLAEQEENKAREIFKKLDDALIDPLLHRSYMNLDFDGYKTFYKNKLEARYKLISQANGRTQPLFLTLNELQALDFGLKLEKQALQSSHLFVEAIQDSSGDNIQKGLTSLNKVYENEKLSPYSIQERIVFLTSNLKLMDSLHQKTDFLISRGYLTIGPNSVNTDGLRKKIKELRSNMKENLEALQEEADKVNNLIDERKDIRQGFYLAGGTVSSDLKTEGGSLLFVDAGLSHIFAPGLNNKTVHIPRLYSGISIYFRPIDKNTRRGSFPSHLKHLKNCGCKSPEECGPDFGVISKASVWQHLSLNLGFTWGMLPNKDFENFYNNMSLLVGPAYRFKRSFKVTGGVSFLKRSSENPLVSGKEIVLGTYLGISTDIDFIQGIKDITSLLLK